METEIKALLISNLIDYDGVYRFNVKHYITS